MAAFVTLNLSERKIGIHLPRILVPEDVHIEQGQVEIMLQPNSREQRYVSGKARVEESNDDPDSKRAIFVEVIYYPDSIWSLYCWSNKT